MFANLFGGLALTVGLLFAGIGSVEEKPTPADCRQSKLACCAQDKGCCQASAKLACCAKGMKCCGTDAGCCAAVQECCKAGAACCNEVRSCCGQKAKNCCGKGCCG